MGQWKTPAVIANLRAIIIFATVLKSQQAALRTQQSLYTYLVKSSRSVGQRKTPAMVVNHHRAMMYLLEQYFSQATFTRYSNVVAFILVDVCSELQAGRTTWNACHDRKPRCCLSAHRGHSVYENVHLLRTIVKTAFTPCCRCGCRSTLPPQHICIHTHVYTFRYRFSRGLKY